MTMTSFNINGGHLDPEEWRQLAFKRSTEHNLQFTVIGGLVLAGMASAGVNPITGIAIAGWTIWSSMEKVKSIGRNQTAVRDYGCIVHLLTDDEFRSYSRQVCASSGEEALIAEIQFAVENGFDLGDSALSYIESASPHIVPGTQPPKLLRPVTRMSVDTATQTQVDNYNPGEKSHVDIVGLMTDKVRNTLIFGLPGSGKGVLVANAIREAKSKHNIKIFVIDPKDDPKDAGYWDGSAYVVMIFNENYANPQQVVEWLEDCFEEYKSYVRDNGRTLLFLDEGTLIGNKVTKAKDTIIQDKLVALTSCGDSEGMNVWIAAQSPFVKGLGIDLSISSQLLAIAIVRDSGCLKQWNRSAILEKISAPQMDALIAHSPCNRSVFFGEHAHWYAMPQLKNYSGYNRDNRQWVDGTPQDALTHTEREEFKTASATIHQHHAEQEPAAPQTQIDILLSRLKDTNCQTISCFISEDLGVFDGSKRQKLRKIILDLVIDNGLAGKFDLEGVNDVGFDPVARIKSWSKGKTPNDQEILWKWEDLTGIILNKLGLKMLKDEF